MAENDPYAEQRNRLVDSLRPEIHDERLLEVMRRVPRERFLTDDQQPYAYEDRPLPIGHGQTNSQPRMIALMVQELRLTGDESVLEVGAGSGYQTALLAELAKGVIGVELIRPLAERAARVLREFGYNNARIELAGETIGWPAEAPYDAIIVAAAAPRIPISLMRQLAPGGRLAIPVGGREGQDLLIAEKRPEGVVVTRRGGCSFVPLLGKEAFDA
ncbi:MAG: protein-L-isoaspartate(D-aspartate) O-methyltransferase [Dehalococcoidia bacterium]